MSKLLEDFRPIFGEAKAKWSTRDLSPLGQFLFHVHSPDSSSLTFHVTDFYSTWEAVKSISQFEDLRGDSGIGGSLSEFVDYIIASLKSGDVKLDLEGQSELNEWKRSYHLTELLSAEQEQNESLQSQLNSLFYSKRQKVQNASENTTNSSQQKSSDYLSSTASKNLSVKENSQMFLSSGKLANQDVASTKTCNRVVPAYRRTKVRGALLQDVVDGDN